MVKKEIKALMIEPGKHPVVTVLNDDLDRCVAEILDIIDFEIKK